MIEDTADYRDIITYYLGKTGFTVTAAHDGRDGRSSNRKTSNSPKSAAPTRSSPNRSSPSSSSRKFTS
jgi:hypothetical protein